jgi:hypothetical protein
VKTGDEKWFGVQASLRKGDDQCFSHGMVKERNKFHRHYV